jgi:hypothetical protein
MNPALVLAIRSHGFHTAAVMLEGAKTPEHELLALRMALATIEGASHVLRTHARALRNTSAAHERGRLRGLEADITIRLGQLLRAARNVQRETA